MSAIDNINSLSQSGRERALRAARSRIAGIEPQLEDFARKVYSKYPPEHTQRMKRLGYALLVPAFFGSAIRIFVAAFETNASYLTGTQHPTLAINGISVVVAVLVGLMSVLLAETGQVAFTLWASSVPEESAGLRAGLQFGAWACMAFALAANFYIVKPFDALPDLGAFALAMIETMLPPLVVLIAANVLKSLALDEIENRHAARMDYEAQHADWMLRVEQAHLHEGWMHAAANELRDAIRNENRRSYKQVRELTNDDWRVLVLRELNADNWYAQSVPAASPALEAGTEEDDKQPPAPAPRVRVRPTQIVGASNSNGRHTGEFANAVQANADGTYIGTCPHCGWVSGPKTNARSATAALIAHKRSCVALRDSMPINAPVVQAAEAVIAEVGDEENH